MSSPIQEGLELRVVLDDLLPELQQLFQVLDCLLGLEWRVSFLALALFGGPRLRRLSEYLQNFFLWWLLSNGLSQYESIGPHLLICVRKKHQNDRKSHRVLNDELRFGAVNQIHDREHPLQGILGLL